jgi:hypothetical protein
MKEARSRHRDLDVAIRASPHEPEFVERDAARTADLSCREASLPADDVARLVAEFEERVARLQTVERPDEARGPSRAAKLAVGDRAEPDLFLHADRVADRRLEHFAEYRIVHRAFGVGAKRSLESTRAKQATDVLGSVWQRSAHRSPRGRSGRRGLRFLLGHLLLQLLGREADDVLVLVAVDVVRAGI